MNMHTQLIDDRQREFNQALRARRFKRALAWIGVVAAGSLLVFFAGLICVLYFNWRSVLIQIGIWALLAWGTWGFMFLKNRH